MTTCQGRFHGPGGKAGNIMEKKEKKTRGFYVEKGSFFVHVSVTLLVLSIAARLLGTMSAWSSMTDLIIQVLLPVGSALLFILFILLLGRVALWSTILPVLGGAAFFILSQFETNASWPLFICIALAFLAAFMYTATLSGMIRTKWLLVFVFLLIFAYQVYRAIPAFMETTTTLRFVDGMALLSSLGFVFSMFCASLALRRRKPPKAETELPKIKDPVVIPPAEQSAEETPAAAPVWDEPAVNDVFAAEESAEAFIPQTESVPTDAPAADQEENTVEQS